MLVIVVLEDDSADDDDDIDDIPRETECNGLIANACFKIVSFLFFVEELLPLSSSLILLPPPPRVVLLPVRLGDELKSRSLLVGICGIQSYR